MHVYFCVFVRVLVDNMKARDGRPYPANDSCCPLNNLFFFFKAESQENENEKGEEATLPGHLSSFNARLWGIKSTGIEFISPGSSPGERKSKKPGLRVFCFQD